MFNWLRKKPAAEAAQARNPGYHADQASLIARAAGALSGGDLVQAVRCYRQALSVDPGSAEIRTGLGAALTGQASYAEAKTHLNRALLLDPANANAHYVLGRIAHKLGDIPAAIELYNEALELKPDFDDVCGDLTNALLARGSSGVAEEMLNKALALRPRSGQLHFILGTLYARSNQYERAEQCLRTSLLLNPAVYEAHSNLGSVLQQQGELMEAITTFEQAMLLSAGNVTAHSNLLWALSFQADGRYLREARLFGHAAAARAKPYRMWSLTPPVLETQRPLRIGFVSGDLRRHPVMTVLEGVLKRLNRGKVELMAYSMNPVDDEVTERIRGYFSQWVSLVGVSDEEAARRIHGDRVDILIDLAGHSAYNRLPVFAWKPAPVQVSWLGYLASTGVPGIDYVLADPVSTPEAVWDQFTEQVWHLPQTFNCFTPPDAHPKLAVTPPPVLRNGHITFGSFQRINKLSGATLELWGRILRAQPQAQLWLRNEAMSSKKVRDRLLERLEQAGIVAARVTFGGNIPGREDYLAVYGEVDIVLDTFPYPGVTTTCDALWMGVPTVTLARGATLGRVGASLLTCAGLPEWVAWSEDEYVALALKHSADVEGLARLRTILRQQVAATPLFDATRFAPQLEDALFGMWQRKMAELEQVAGGVAQSEISDTKVVDGGVEGGSAGQARLGAQALAQGDLVLASRHYLRAVQSDPADADAKVGLAYVLTEQGRHAEAKPYLEAACVAAPENADAVYLLSKVAQQEQDLPAVLDYLGRALDLRPAFEAAFNDLAALYFSNRQLHHAASSILHVVGIRTERGMFHHSIGDFCDAAGELTEAVASYREALLYQPAEATTHCNLGHVLLKLGDFEPAGTHLRRAIAIKPGYFSAHSNLLWMLSFHADGGAAEYVAEARHYGKSVLAAARPFTNWKHSAIAAGGRLRVGFVSGDFRAHPIGYFLEGIVRNLNPAKLELIAYSMNPQDDAMTERIKASFAQWIPIAALSDAEAARKIHADGVDILIDLAGHSGLNRLPLFAWKPAPLQLSWFGYLGSTGVPGMDYVLADPVAAPETVQEQFTEQVWHLPETLNCYTPPPEHPAIAVAAPPALRNGYITFGSCQRLNKLSEETLLLWAKVLRTIPNARLRLQNGQLDSPEGRARLQQRLANAGIALGRCILHGAIDGKENHLAAHAQVDIVLDTPHYPGTTTTCEALWMGVPTLTLAGNTLLTRVGASVLTCAGLSGWVAKTEEEYVALAVQHASDIEGLAQLRAGLRQQVAATALFDAGQFAPQLEAALFAMWERRAACSTG